MNRTIRFRPSVENMEPILCLSGLFDLNPDPPPMPESPITVLPSPIPDDPFGAVGNLFQGLGDSGPEEPYGTVPQQGLTPPCLANSCPGDAPIGSPYLISGLVPSVQVA